MWMISNFYPEYFVALNLMHAVIDIQSITFSDWHAVNHLQWL